MARLDELIEVYAGNREEWRAWLSEHHATSPGCWLVYYKVGSGQPSVCYDEVVEECLCFGWIDSKIGPIDGSRYRQLITPRKPKSVWSKVNKERLVRLIAEGRMMPAGLAKLEAAKLDGSWTTLDTVEEGVVPADLAEALNAVPEAARNFHAFPFGARKQYLYWIEMAKRADTRALRIAETVRFAAANIKQRP